MDLSTQQTARWKSLLSRRVPWTVPQILPVGEAFQVLNAFKRRVNHHNVASRGVLGRSCAHYEAYHL
jgi:hypothetical protein